MDKWFVEIFDLLGRNSSYVLVIIAVFRMISRVKYLISFLALCLINVNLVKCLKIWIREPRPVKMIEDTTNPEYYGMPSGHAYHNAFITVFLWMVNPSWIVLYLCVVVGSVSLIERYKQNRHTVGQLFAGTIGGALFAYVCVSVLRYYFEKSAMYTRIK